MTEETNEWVRCTTLAASLLSSTWTNRGRTAFLDQIEHTVQAVSLMDALGSTVYNIVIMRRLQSGKPLLEVEKPWLPSPPSM